MCPVMPFLALACADRAFHPLFYTEGLVISNGLNIGKVRTMLPERGRDHIELRWRKDIYDTPVFRAVKTDINEKHIDGLRVWSVSSLGRYLKCVGECAGIEGSVMPYFIRREVGTEIISILTLDYLPHQPIISQGAGVPDTQRNHALEHANILILLKHYLATRSAVDIYSVFLGTISRAEQLREVGKQCLRRGAPARLTPDQIDEAERDHGVMDPSQQCRDYKNELLAKYIYISRMLHRNNRSSINSSKTAADRPLKRRSALYVYKLYAISTKLPISTTS